MQRLKSKARAHPNTSAILPSSLRLPEVQNWKRPLVTHDPDDPDPPALTWTVPHQVVGLFVCFSSSKPN